VKGFLQKHEITEDHNISDLEISSMKHIREGVSEDRKTAVDTRTPILVDQALFEDFTRETCLQMLGKIGVTTGEEVEFATDDFNLARESDGCAENGCGGTLRASKGIEVGHVFYLGTKYSAKFNAKILSPTTTNPAEMGCYGLGVTRILASVVETSHDENGIIWPPPIAPYKVVVIVMNPKDEDLQSKALEVYTHLNESHGLKGEVVLDDRHDNPGPKIKDAQLLGFPWMVLVGKAMKREGYVEIENRRTKQKTFLPPHAVAAFLCAQDP